ncbi:MAG TPA: YfhO family protein, partial [Thermoanaerobaculia bacterium]|nr:YfhO family protein [Thermoanaerobaculia bacterium]
LPTASFDASILLMVLPPAAFAVAALAARGRARVLSGVAIALFLPTHLAEMPRLYPTFPSRLFYPPVPELDALPRADEPYRTTALGYDLVPNQSALYGLEDVRGYQAVENARSASTYSLWCVPQPVWFNRIDDLTKPFLSFLNVRFAIAGPGQAVPAGWRELRRGPRCAVFENPAALPRAFAPESVRFVPDPSKTVELMRSCRDFSKVAWIEDSARPEGEAPNGRARVTATARGADLDVHVDAQSRSWIVVSQTAWRGWEAREGARLLPLRFANQAFLAFEVGPGRHEVRLEYRPRSFRLGVGLALASAAALVAVGILGRRRARTRIAPNAPAI